jgi:hypothetical protein
MSPLIQIWVHPKFKKKLKKEAIEKDLTLADYTFELANLDDPLSDLTTKKGRKQNDRFLFNF